MVVARTVLGRAYPVIGDEPDRWTVALPPDFVWTTRNITRRRWATSERQAVADLFYKLHLKPREWERDGPAIWASGRP